MSIDPRDPDRAARQRTLVRIAAIGLYATVGLIAFLAWLAREGTPLGEVAWLTVGGLVTLFGNLLMTAFNFEFGSSAGSQAKDLRAAPPAPSTQDQPEQNR